ncbi:MAG: macro domain-containing protein [Anaerolineae bacterium]|nr:macro domain-containing protein [Anaerolineae bacterium]
MKVVLADLNKALIDEWVSTFKNVDDVSVYHGSIFDVACDAIVSPANSYGYMDGGLDLAISEYLGWHVQARLQERIKTYHHGELLVGLADIIPTDHPQTPYLISAPTMRVPMVLCRTSSNPYLAMRAVLLLIKFGTLADGSPVKDVVQTVAVPGLGTGVGEVPPSICANQMFQAINDFMYDNYQFPGSWFAAMRMQAMLCS